MTQIHCWNEYDSLKTVILGSVFDNDRIPETYQGIDQENFIKIVEETNQELKNIQIVLQQFGVNVLRPKQPKSYNGLELPYHEPLINMRDFHMAYGNIFFMTYGPYHERRYQHLWIEEIVNNFILSGNLIVNANELNMDDGNKINYQNVLDNSQAIEYYNLKTEYDLLLKKKTDKILNLLKKNKHFEKYFNNEGKNLFDWYILHQCKYKNKNLFHTASLLKFNKQAFLSTFNGNDIGNKWIENWLRSLNVEIIYVPYAGHIDAKYAILNDDTLLRIGIINQEITSHFKEVIEVETYPVPYLKDFPNLTNPTEWLTKWKKINFSNKVNCNALSIDKHNILLNFYDKNLFVKLKNSGINAEYVKWTNGDFWEGGLHCITCDIERRPE